MDSLRLSIEFPKAADFDQQPIEVKDDPFFVRNLEDSCDILNILKQEERCQQSECLNSKDKFPSMMRSIERSIDRTGGQRTSAESHPKSLHSFAEEYNQMDRPKFEIKKPDLLKIVPIQSEDQAEQQPPPPQQPIAVEKKRNYFLFENLRAMIPEEHRNILSEINPEYLKALENMEVQPEIKSDRRRRVERYLEKRRLKTWNKKICYNCRQKVAEERLRVKGRFIGRKKAIELLGLKERRGTAEIKQMLDKIEHKQ